MKYLTSFLFFVKKRIKENRKGKEREGKRREG
jgi:hypothetical protein